jgi:sulfur relay protein TusB/DsrH
MNKDKQKIDIGFLITKAPLESGNVSNVISLAEEAINNGKKVEIFLISDGIWLAKSDQKNKVAERFIDLIKRGVNVTVSKEHLEAAGITNNELVNGLKITDDPYASLVDLVMEKWEKVLTI